MRNIKVLLPCAVCCGIILLLSGCSAPCNYPVQGPIHVRIVNAIPDLPMITVRLNGRILVKDYPYDFPVAGGYLTSYADMTPLQPGTSIPIVVSSDAAGSNILIKDSISSIDYRRQTIIAMGKAHPIAGSDQPAKVLKITDDTPTNPSATLVRFIHAIPDLPALDIFWHSSGPPNATVRYGQDNPYFDLTNGDSLKVTEAGNPNNVIFFFPYKFTGLSNINFTTIVKGESKPVDTNHIASILVLNDDTTGNAFISFGTFFLRFVNASRSLKLSLLIEGSVSQGFRANYPGQGAVLNISPESSGNVLPLSPILNGNSVYAFSTSVNTSDTVISFKPSPFIQDRFFTIVAIENTTLGQTAKSLDNLILSDTIDVKPAASKVRVVNANPDHQHIGFTLAGRTVSMVKKQVEFFDVLPGAQMLTLDDGTSQKQVSFTAPAGRAVTLYLMPATQADSFPVTTSVNQ